MRKIEDKSVADAISDEDETLGFLDWKDGPPTVLEQVDTLLEAFGLEVVVFETGADDYLFRIEKRST